MNVNSIRCTVTIFAFACAAVAQVGRPGKKAAAPSHPNVLLVTIDTTRADHIGCYGYGNIKTPTIDGLAHDGLLFERAISQVPLTWPSHVGILTGTYPIHNGVQDFTGQPLAAEFRSVAQSFSDHGYATAAVISSFVLNRTWGLARGFGYYNDAFSGNSFLESGIGLVQRKAEDSINLSLTWLNRRPAAKPFFFWLHLYDPHSAYEPPEPFFSQYQGHEYDGEIAYADAQLGRVIGWLKQNGLYDNTAVVVLSDHGESLGEHGEKEHGFFIYNATVHVPLVIKPSGKHAGQQRIRNVIEITAVAPTLLELAGIRDRISAQFDTAALLPRPKDEAAYSETTYPFSSFGWNPLHGMETAEYHYIEAPRSELYDLDRDPHELHNLLADQPATAATLKQKLSQRLAKKTSVASENRAANDEAVRAKLRALGYIAYHSPVPASALDKPLADPKDKVAELQSILEASDAFRLGKTEQGIQMLKTVQGQDPNLYVIPFMLGEAALDRTDWNEAATQLERSLQLNPEFEDAMTALGRALHGLGRDEEAETWTRKAIEKNPRNFRAWYELGWIQASQRPDEALKALHKTIELQPNFALAFREMGMLEYRKKDYANAADHLQKAIDFGLTKPYLLNFLGISYSRTGQLKKAVDSYILALREKPDYADAHLNLGFAYERLQQLEKAAEEYATACRLDAKLCKMLQQHN